MPCYRCGVRQTDPSRGQSPWKRGVRQYSQILICPGCQDTADWTAELDRCSQCSSVHLVKRLGEVECRDCGAIVPPEDAEPGYSGLLAEPPGEEPALAGLADAAPGSAGDGPAGAGRSPDLSEEVARALDRVLGRSLVSQSLQRAPDMEGKPGSGAVAGSGTAASVAGGHRPARTAAGHHSAAHPGAERHRAARPGASSQGVERLDEVRPGAFAG